METLKALVEKWRAEAGKKNAHGSGVYSVEMRAKMYQLLACAVDLEAALKSPWHPIATAPKDGRWILVYFPEIGVWPALWSTQVYDDGFWSVSDNKFEDRGIRGWSKEPTHWMPLPSPPEGR